MMPFLENSGIHVACVGNHDFDYGIEKLDSFIKRLPFPWLLSNVKCKEKNLPLSSCREFLTTEHQGYKIGLMGLAELGWLEHIDTFELEDVNYEPFIDAGKRLQKKLKEEGCDFIIALTHI
jgi:5'-nucleotidase